MSERLWQYGGYWIAPGPETDILAAYWYDAGKRQTRRRSLGTKVLAEACDRLIELVGSANTDGSRSPDRVMMLSALDHYYEHDVKLKPSGEQAFRAITLIREFLSVKAAIGATVAAFGPMRQREFMHWCRDTFEHSPSTIARNLSVVSAAFRFGKRLVVIKDKLGNEHEIQLLDMAPDVVTQAPRVAELSDLPEPTPRDWLPTFEELGRFIDAVDKRQENLFRFVIIALNTWARPQTVLDFRDTEETVNRRFGTIDLNPAGRRQTVKYRPKIRLTDNLRGWLDQWQTTTPMVWNDEPVAAIKRTFVRHAAECGIPDFTPGTLRHFMATYVRREKPPVSKEQRDVWLGHDEKRTANAYEAFDPEYLSDCQRATESVIRQLQDHTRRPLFAFRLRADPGLRVLQGGKGG